MADVDKAREGEEDEQSKPKKGLSPMMLIIIGLVGTIIVGTIAFVIVYKVITAKPDEEPVETKKEVSQAAYFGKLFSFDEPIIVNLAGTKGQRYLKVSIKFEVTDDSVVEELNARKPLMLDLLISVLSSKTIEDVSNTVGRNRLRREIIDKSNAELVAGKVINVYFTEFVIQ
jgi:flagellar protein FliL